MTTTTIRINAVYDGYEFKDSSYYCSKRGYWVNVIISTSDNQRDCRRIWAPSYDELKMMASSRYGIELPDSNKLCWMNFGTPYNTAKINITKHNLQ